MKKDDYVSDYPVILSGFYFDDPSRTPYEDVPSCNKEFINQFYYKIVNQSEFRMVGAVGTAHSCSNPNTTVWNSKGIWLTYILMILFLHFTLLSIPGNDFNRL